jgi:hypothetical protein
LRGTCQNSLCRELGSWTTFLSWLLLSTFPVLRRNSSTVHSRVGVTVWGGLSGAAGARSMVRLALEPRRSRRPLGARRRPSSLRSGVTSAGPWAEYMERVRRFPSRRGEGLEGRQGTSPDVVTVGSGHGLLLSDSRQLVDVWGTGSCSQRVSVWILGFSTC